jgi:hypothetical protein
MNEAVQIRYLPAIVLAETNGAAKMPSPGENGYLSFSMGVSSFRIVGRSIIRKLNEQLPKIRASALQKSIRPS